MSALFLHVQKDLQSLSLSLKYKTLKSREDQKELAHRRAENFSKRGQLIKIRATNSEKVSVKILDHQFSQDN